MTSDQIPPPAFGHLPAAVCRRGHVRDSGLRRGESVEPVCPRCGVSVLVACMSCGHRIRGRFEEYAVIGAKFDPPAFCDSCGAPHPWAGRQAMIYQLENLLDDEDLDGASQLEARDQLERLRVGGLDEQEDVKVWTRLKELAPGVLKSGAQIVTAVATQAALKQLGLN